MAVREGKNRFMITLPNELYDKVNNNADTNKRNISNEIEYVLDKYYSNEQPLYDLKRVLLEADPFTSNEIDINLFEGLLSNIYSLYDTNKDKSNVLMLISLILQKQDLNDKLVYMFKYLSDNYTFKKD